MWKFYLFGIILVLSATGGTAVLTYNYTENLPTTYVASVKLFIDQSNSISTAPGTNSITKIQQLIPTYAQLATSYAIGEMISDDNPQIGAEEAKLSLSAFPVEKTQMLLLQSRSSEPDMALLIASSAADNLITMIKNQQNETSIAKDSQLIVKVIDPATSVTAETPSNKRTLGLATFAAFFVTAGGLAVFHNSRR